MVGSPQGWDIHSDAMVLYKVPNTNKTYYGAFFFPLGYTAFRFYEELGDWDHSSVGASYEDNGFDVEMDYEGECYDGKGSWTFNWTGGMIYLTVNLETHTVKFSSTPEYLYMIGTPQGWNIEDGSFILSKDSAEGNIFSGSFKIAEDYLMARFYSVLGDWNNGSIGPLEEDNAVSISLNYHGPCLNGLGCWSFEWQGGDILYTAVDLGNMTVDFSTTPLSVEAITDTEDLVYREDKVISSGTVHFSVFDASGKLLVQSYSDVVDLGKLSDGIYIVRAGSRTLKVVR